MRSGMMCGVVLAVVASAASAAEQEQAQESEAPRTFVGLAPVSLGQGLLGLDGEQVLGPRLSARLGVRLGAGLGATRGDIAGIDSRYFQVGFEPGLRYYLTGTALDGVWLGSNLELSHLWLEHEPSQGNAGSTTHNRDWNLGVAALAGYSMVVSRGLTVQAGLGFGASYGSGRMTVRDDSNPNNVLEARFDTEVWTIDERATLVVGWAF
ncbi:DUF3575 domain-containing protein [Hyalangium versicolor]|uniref:DUF3575 domain-containing protein n=1 Tax=Hyalangium versicolor TaxID=2861190 RepID=UPI001CCC72BE|nr:DUF3575 domain-containing protein [Hyalangium versicolor]